VETSVSEKGNAEETVCTLIDLTGFCHWGSAASIGFVLARDSENVFGFE